MPAPEVSPSAGTVGHDRSILCKYDDLSADPFPIGSGRARRLLRPDRSARHADRASGISERAWPNSTSPSSAAASTAPASRATRPAAACACCSCEQNDLASGTSSASTKLIHGGLRYLEHYEFRLVREALAEREVLLRHGAAHHPADALRAAAPPAPAPGLDAPARPVPLRPPRAAATSCRRPRRVDLTSAPGRAAAEAAVPRAASTIPIAGSTTRGSSCSTRIDAARARRDDPHAHALLARRASVARIGG